MNPTDHLVLSALHHFADAQGTVTESTRAIGAHVGRSAPAVATSLKRLTEMVYVQRLPKTSVRSVGRFKIMDVTASENRGKGFLKTWPLSGLESALPDMFRSPALRTAGVLHRAAAKGQKTTVSELLELGVVRTPKTLRKTLNQLSDLPSPLASEHADPLHKQRAVWIIHPLTDEAEAINLACLNLIPGAEPKTRAQHQQENAAATRNYMQWFGGHDNPALAYERDIAPFVVSDPENIGCEIWTGEVNESGYSMPYPGRPNFTGHRLSWLAFVGYLAPGHALHHSCAVRRCVYPGHLVPMTPEQHRAVHAP
ncbi:HNH endonuclease [Paeniglutamicibacter sp. ORCA_105]|uniref:HNH endonuclease n=1 Tax=Paeniglutamicibacter sp. ORCA_105 TaxID=3377336 RepID=UPI0038966A7B